MAMNTERTGAGVSKALQTDQLKELVLEFTESWAKAAGDPYDSDEDCWTDDDFLECRLLKFAERIAALAVQAQWQPIETAPKDATPVLGYRKSMDDMVVASFQVGRWILDAGWPLRPDAPLTHWMPLPAPPQAERPSEETR